MSRYDLAEQVRHALTRYHMLSPGDLVLVAVSGGPDSVALLTVLDKLAPGLQVTLHVFHLDHMLRPESGEDAAFVKSLAKSMHLPASIETFDVGSYGRERGLGLETASREVRYRMMRKAAAEAGAAKIATGHTLDDQAETFFMRLVRGAGTTGLASIPPVRENIIRPLLGSGRQDVLDWCEAHELAYRVDETNLLPDQIRNAIRLEVIPVLKKLNPNVAQTIADAAEILRAEDEFLSALASIRFQEMSCRRPAGEIQIPLEQLRELPPALARRVLRQAFVPLGDPSAIAFRALEEPLSRALSGEEVEARLPGELELFTEYGYLVLGKTEKPPPSVEVELAVPGSTEIREMKARIGVSLQKGPMEASTSSDMATVNKGAIRGTLRATTFRPGDRFRPFGMDGEKKLQDYFVDEKVPRRQRWRVPVIRDDEGIVWIAGFRIDERFRIDEATEEVVVLSIEG